MLRLSKVSGADAPSTELIERFAKLDIDIAQFREPAVLSRDVLVRSLLGERGIRQKQKCCLRCKFCSTEQIIDEWPMPRSLQCQAREREELIGEIKMFAREFAVVSSIESEDPARTEQDHGGVPAFGFVVSERDPIDGSKIVDEDGVARPFYRSLAKRRIDDRVDLIIESHEGTTVIGKEHDLRSLDPCARGESPRRTPPRNLGRDVVRD